MNWYRKKKKINAQKRQPKTSFFCNFWHKKKVEILNKMYKNSVSIIMKIRKNENGVSTGTLVKIQLKPINVI